MSYKELKFDIDARSEMKLGVDKLANAVKITLGARGRNVVIERKFGFPLITGDGVTVAKEIDLENKIENIGAQMVKEVASRTNDDAGDGTTTATVLAQSIIEVGLKNVTSGANPVDLKRGINKAVAVVVNSIKNQSKDIGVSGSQIEQIATISANNDAVIGKLIADAMDVAGATGVIKVEEARGIDDELKRIEGMEIERGYTSPHFITDKEKGEAVLENPYILITSNKISSMKDILPIVEYVSKQNKPLFIIAEDVEGEVFQTLVINKMRGNFKVAAIKAPSFGDDQIDVLEDLAALTGAAVISNESGLVISEVGPECLGSCEKVIIDKSNTVIIGGHGDVDDIDSRTKELKSLLKESSEPFTTKIQDRLAKLTGGVAVLYIGAPSELEMKEKRARVDDALSATKAAVEEGVVPGGGVAYIRAISELNSIVCENEDEQIGVNIIKKAIESPFRQILINAGIEPAEHVGVIMRSTVSDYGYNVRTEKYEKFFKTGIIDPAKVTRVAIENAASVAGMLLTTECVISRYDDEPEMGMMPQM